MKQNKRTRINIKTKEVLIIRNGFAPLEIYCPNCGAEVEILTPQQAIERGFHLSETESEVITSAEEKITGSNTILKK